MELLVGANGGGVVLEASVLDEELLLGEVRELGEPRGVLESLVVSLDLLEVLEEYLESVLPLGRGRVGFSELGLPGLENRHDRVVLAWGGNRGFHGLEVNEARGDH